MPEGVTTRAGSNPALSASAPGRFTWRRSGCLIVANPKAGGDVLDIAAAIAARCRRRIGEPEVMTTEYAGHAEAIAGEAAAAGRFDVVVTVGGDGTARDVAAGLHRGAVPDVEVPALLPLPGGTGNSFYREIWADRPWPETLESVLTGATVDRRRIDLARIEETGDVVLLGACSGLVADALAVAAGIDGLSGRELYARAVAETVRSFRPYPGRVYVDGAIVHEGPAVLANVGGGRYRGGGYLLLPHSLLDDGLLDVCVVGGELDPRLLPDLTRDGRHVEHDAVVYARGSRITIERTDGEPLSFEHDGELRLGHDSSRTLTVLPRAVPVLAPSTRSDRRGDRRR
ncbi:MAG TPA: diacylglycerol kinase family protein [Streptosporangiaceae bacterium]